MQPRQKQEKHSEELLSKLGRDARELHLTGSIGSRCTSWRTALTLLATGRVQVGPLASEPLPLSEWQEAFERFEAKHAIKVLLRPE